MDPVRMGRSLGMKMPDTNTALVTLGTLLTAKWPGVEGYVTRAMEMHGPVNWRARLPMGALRQMEADLNDPVDILDFSEAFLGWADAPPAMVAAITHIMRNDIELQSKTASIERLWGPVLRRTATVAPGLDGYDALMAAQKAYQEGLQKAELGMARTFNAWISKAQKALKPYGIGIDVSPQKTYIEARVRSSDGVRTEGRVEFIYLPAYKYDRYLEDIIEEVLGVSGVGRYGSTTWDFGG